MEPKAPTKTDSLPRRPNSFLYWLAVHVCAPFFKLFYGLQIDRSGIEGLDGPVVVLSNHQANTDFILTAAALYPIKLNFMVTTYFFHHTLLAWLLRKMGCIPKRQYLADTASVRMCLGIAKRGGSLGIFPEGQVCYTGENNLIDRSIAKLCKKLGMTVVTAAIRGNHLSYPKWGCGKKYRGRVECTVSVLYTPEQLKALSVDEIYDGILSRLTYNEYEWQRSKQVAFRPKHDTNGLQSILYRCPACKSDCTIASKNGALVCEACGYSVAFGDDCLFHLVSGERLAFDNPAAWHDWEFAEIERALAAGEGLEAPAKLLRTVDGKFGYSPCGEGTLRADARGLHFEGLCDGAPFSISALAERQGNVTHNAKRKGIDVEGETCNYLLAPENPRMLGKFISYFVAARKRIEAERR